MPRGRAAPIELPAPRIAVRGTWYRITRARRRPVLLDRGATGWSLAARHGRPRHLPRRRRGDGLGRVVPAHGRGGRTAGPAAAAGDLAGRGRSRGRRGPDGGRRPRRARVDRLDPTRRQWPETQPIGHAYYRDGASAVLAPSAARRGGRVLAVFRRGRTVRGVEAIPPPQRHDRLPYVPRGLRT